MSSLPVTSQEHFWIQINCFSTIITFAVFVDEQRLVRSRVAGSYHAQIRIMSLNKSHSSNSACRSRTPGVCFTEAVKEVLNSFGIGRRKKERKKAFARTTTHLVVSIRLKFDPHLNPMLHQCAKSDASSHNPDAFILILADTTQYQASHLRVAPIQRLASRILC